MTGLFVIQSQEWLCDSLHTGGFVFLSEFVSKNVLLSTHVKQYE